MSKTVDLFKRYNKRIDDIYKLLFNGNLSQKVIDEIMQELYSLLRNAGEDFYINHQVDPSYIELINKANLCELILPMKYICDVKSNYDEISKIITYPQNNFSSIEEILDYIVFQSRNFLLNEANPLPFLEQKPFDEIELTNKCIIISKYISYICEKLGLKENRVKIDPAFNSSIKLYNGNGYHYFNIVIINNKEYIIDCTYKQFFLLYQSYIEKLGLLYSTGCSPGIYMLYDNQHAKTALTILKRGWIEATDTNLKNYLDGFAISYRNGLYYDENNTLQYDTKYTAQEYREMLFGDKSQLDYEDEAWLGYQNKPLNNKTLRFVNKPETEYFKIS